MINYLVVMESDLDLEELFISSESEWDWLSNEQTTAETIAKIKSACNLEDTFCEISSTYDESSNSQALPGKYPEK